MSSIFGRLLNQTSDIEVVYAIRAYEIDGVQYCDVVNPDSGQQPAMQCIVAGVDGKPLGVPAAPWGPDSDISNYPLVLIAKRSDGRQPVVLDVLRNPALQYTSTPATSGGATTTDSTASPPNVNLNDRVIKNGGSTVVVRENGEVLIDAAASLNIQLTSGVMRVRSNGDADDRALLATPSVAKLNELIVLLNTLVAALQAGALSYVETLPMGPAAAAAAGWATLSTALAGASVLDLALAAELQSAALYLPSTAGP